MFECLKYVVVLSESIDVKIVELQALPQYDSKHIAAMGYISGSITDISSLATRGNNVASYTKKPRYICTFLHHLKIWKCKKRITTVPRLASVKLCVDAGEITNWYSRLFAAFVAASRQQAAAEWEM